MERSRVDSCSFDDRSDPERHCAGRPSVGPAKGTPVPLSRWRVGVWAVAVVLAAGCSDSHKPPPTAPPPPPSYWSPAIHQQSPTWSPRGLIAYRDWGVVSIDVGGAWLEDASLAGIWILDTSTGATRKFLSFGENPCWSPDGSTLAFEWGAQIFVIAADGSNLRQLTFADANFGPTWNPSGTRILYNSLTLGNTIESRIFSIPAEGGTPEILCTGLVRHGQYPTWAPDGKRIVMAWLPGDSVLQSQIFTLDSASCTPTRVLTDDTWDSYPCFSPDGGTLAFTAQTDDGSPPNLWILRRRDGLRQLTKDGAVEPAWSPDGQWIAFRNDEPKYSPRQQVIWKVNVNDGRLVQLTEQWVEPCDDRPLIACRKATPGDTVPAQPARHVLPGDVRLRRFPDFGTWASAAFPGEGGARGFP
jgi:hypothetical protein